VAELEAVLKPPDPQEPPRGLVGLPQRLARQLDFRRLYPKEGLTTFVILAFGLLSAVWAVQGARWVEDLPPLAEIAIGGLLFGTILAKTRLPGYLTHPVAVLYGVVITTWGVQGIIRLPTWPERLVDLILRLNYWAYAARTGGINNDPLPFVFMITALAWFLAYSGAWFVFRRRSAVGAMLPVGVAMLFNLRYAPSHLTIYFFMYLFAALLLAMRLNFYVFQRRWDLFGIRYPREMGLTVIPNVALVVGAILVLTAVLPASADQTPVADLWNRINTPVQDAQSEFNRLFASLTAKEGTDTAYFGRTLALKGSITLGNRVVFYVFSPRRYYWLGLTYDTYTGQGWLSGERRTVQLAPGNSLTTTVAYRGREEVVEVVRMNAVSSGLVFLGGQGIQFNVPVVIEYDPPTPMVVDLRDRSLDAQLPEELRPAIESIRQALAEQSDLGERDQMALIQRLLPPEYVAFGPTITGGRVARFMVNLRRPSYMEVAAIRPVGGIRFGQQYSVRASISTATGQDLRRAGTSYPQYITDRYLQLPPNFPPRIRQLAQELTRGLTNNYDKAKAIEAYLQQFPYDTNIPQPPPNRDGVEWFLFDLKRGYCDYFASAMAVMLRSIGIPARVAVGYMSGTYNPDIGAYEVRESDAHSWPQVFFPDYGWVDFEPSPRAGAGVPRVESLEQGTGEGVGADILRDGPGAVGPEEMLPDEGFFGGEFSTSESGSDLSWSLLGLLVIPVGALAGLGVAGMVWWRRRFGPLDLVSQTYEKVLVLAQLAGLRPRPWQTPLEFAERLRAEVGDVGADIETVFGAFVRVRFGRRQLDEAEQARVAAAWGRLRSRIVRRILTRR
jgi:transglutaminase-like putative cysteine protease